MKKLKKMRRKINLFCVLFVLFFGGEWLGLVVSWSVLLCLVVAIFSVIGELI